MRSQILPSAVLAALFPLIAMHAMGQAAARLPGEIAWAINCDPSTFDPAKVDEDVSELVRYLTAGVLVRINRETQMPEPQLAESYRISAQGTTIEFKLRGGLRFSDGSSLTAADVAWSVRRILSPSTGSVVADEFLLPGQVTIDTPDKLTIRVHLPRRVVGLERIFDEIAIEPVNRPNEGRVTAGPFTVADYKRGQYVRLRRNPNYWERDANGVQLPYATSIRLDVLNNREQQIALFLRGEYDLIDHLPADLYRVVAMKAPASVRDLGPSLNTEQLWFNQSLAAPLPQYEISWFRNRSFRVAISEAIHRNDLARISYDGHATPAYSFISPANKLWYNSGLNFPRESATDASRLLAQAGLHRKGNQLIDSTGHVVRFSILTNAGNPARQKTAVMIQQDLAALGMQITIVTLDFPALIERLMHKQDYEACLLGHADTQPDPSSTMNEWLSSSPNHQWNPSEKTPATDWEAEIDKQMKLQASSPSQQVRKAAVDRVQQIVADQQPFIYLVYPNILEAISPRLQGLRPAIVAPGPVWKIEFMRRDESRGQGKAR